jgi:salicylate hydroxylase
MAPTLGQGATQAVEDACVAVEEIRRALRQTHHTGMPLQAPRLVAAIGWRRLDRVRFVQRLSWEASDTMLAGGDPVAGTRAKMEPAFLDRLATLYRDV